MNNVQTAEHNAQSSPEIISKASEDISSSSSNLSTVHERSNSNSSGTSDQCSSKPGLKQIQDISTNVQSSMPDDSNFSEQQLPTNTSSYIIPNSKLVNSLSSSGSYFLQLKMEP